MLVTIPPTNDPDFRLPEHPDGEPWPYAALDAEGVVTLSDTATELVAKAIDGYDTMGDDEALAARYDSLVELGELLQEHLRSAACIDGRWDPATATEDTLTVLYRPRTVPLTETAVWEHEVPLVAISTDYLPFTDRPEPSGRIVWLDPSTELTYLQTLDRIGVIELHVHSGGAKVAEVAAA